MKWTKQILLVFSIITTQTLVAQSSIEGYVYNKKDNTSVEYVTVTLLSTDSIYIAGTLTNESGYFNFHINKAIKYIARISCIGYNTEYKDINPTMLDSMIYIPINENINQLSEIFIVGKKPPVENLGEMIVVNINSYMNPSGKNTVDVLKVLPGITYENESLFLTGKSVKIYIDGRPSHLSGKDLINYLSTLQGDQIEKVELILNPTEKYDAGFSGAVVNIKLKRNESLGLKGSIGNTIAIWGYNKYVMPTINMNYRCDKLNIYGGYTFLHNYTENILEYDRKYKNIDEPLHYNENGINNGKMNYHSYNLGMDFSITDKHEIGLLFNGINNNTNNDNNIWTKIKKIDTKNIDSLLFSPIRTNRDSYDYQGNIHYIWKIDTLGSQLSVDLNYMDIESKNKQLIPIHYYLPDIQTEYRDESGYGQNVVQKMKYWSGRIDYERKIFKNSDLNVGVKYDKIKRSNNLTAYNNNTGTWEHDENLSNIFEYEENIYATYFSLKKALGKFFLSAGIRWELTRQKGIQLVNNESFDKKYNDWFPSLSIQYNMKNNQSIMLSYTRKISRPIFSMMNPFMFYTSPQTYQVGNPNLNPSYKNSVSMRITKKRASFTLLYNCAKNEAVQEAFQDDEIKVLGYRYVNFGSAKLYQASLYYPIKLTNWWSVSLNASCSYKDIESLLNQEYFKKRFFYTTASLYHTFNIKNRFSADLYATVLSDRWNTASHIKTRGYMEASITKNLWNEKASVSLGVTDPFRWGTFRSSYVFQNIDEKAREINNSRIIKLSFNYKFGSGKIKGNRSRNTGVEDTQQRIN